MQPRTQLAVWIVLGLLGMVALFVVSALLPAFTLVFVLMALLIIAFGIVAWRVPRGD